MNQPIVVSVTGASGAIYAVRLIDVLLAAGRDVHLSISAAGAEVLAQELDVRIDAAQFCETDLWAVRKLPFERATPVGTKGEPTIRGQLSCYTNQDFFAPMASGSFLTAGMVICPCSGTTLSAVAHGLASNLIQRAAEVHLKERRPLILVPREAPLSLSHIDNMRRATEAGAVILPAAPGWYHQPAGLSDLVDFVVGRIIDQLGVDCELHKRWGS